MVAPLTPTDVATIDSLTARLRAAGLRATQARVHTLTALMASSEAESHEALADRLAQSLGPGVLDRTTVYRNLVAFTRAGILRREHGADRIFRYRLAGTIDQHRRAHPHFSCNACGTTQCLPEAAVRLHGTAQTLGNRINGLEVTLSGQCERCTSAEVH